MMIRTLLLLVLLVSTARADTIALEAFDDVDCADASCDPFMLKEVLAGGAVDADILTQTSTVHGSGNGGDPSDQSHYAALVTVSTGKKAAYQLIGRCSCTTNADCGSAPVACVSDPSRRSNKVCLSGTASRVSCIANSDCAAGQKCLTTMNAQTATGAFSGFLSVPPAGGTGRTVGKFRLDDDTDGCRLRVNSDAIHSVEMYYGAADIAGPVHDNVTGTIGWPANACSTGKRIGCTTNATCPSNGLCNSPYWPGVELVESHSASSGGGGSVTCQYWRDGVKLLDATTQIAGGTIPNIVNFVTGAADTDTTTNTMTFGVDDYAIVDVTRAGAGYITTGVPATTDSEQWKATANCFQGRCGAGTDAGTLCTASNQCHGKCSTSGASCLNNTDCPNPQTCSRSCNEDSLLEAVVCTNDYGTSPFQVVTTNNHNLKRSSGSQSVTWRSFTPITIPSTPLGTSLAAVGLIAIGQDDTGGCLDTAGCNLPLNFSLSSCPTSSCTLTICDGTDPNCCAGQPSCTTPCCLPGSVLSKVELPRRVGTSMFLGAGFSEVSAIGSAWTPDSLAQLGGAVATDVSWKKGQEVRINAMLTYARMTYPDSIPHIFLRDHNKGPDDGQVTIYSCGDSTTRGTFGTVCNGGTEAGQNCGQKWYCAFDFAKSKPDGQDGCSGNSAVCETCAGNSVHPRDAYNSGAGYPCGPNNQNVDCNLGACNAGVCTNDDSVSCRIIGGVDQGDCNLGLCAGCSTTGCTEVGANPNADQKHTCNLSCPGGHCSVTTSKQCELNSQTDCPTGETCVGNPGVCPSINANYVDWFAKGLGANNVYNCGVQGDTSEQFAGAELSAILDGRATQCVKVSGSSMGCTCQVNKDCGRCSTHKSQGCLVGTDCPSGESCITGTCSLQSCSTDANCSYGGTCVSGTCQVGLCTATSGNDQTRLNCTDINSCCIGAGCTSSPGNVCQFYKPDYIINWFGYNDTVTGGLGAQSPQCKGTSGLTVPCVGKTCHWRCSGNSSVSCDGALVCAILGIGSCVRTDQDCASGELCLTGIPTVFGDSLHTCEKTCTSDAACGSFSSSSFCSGTRRQSGTGGAVAVAQAMNCATTDFFVGSCGATIPGCNTDADCDTGLRCVGGRAGAVLREGICRCDCNSTGGTCTGPQTCSVDGNCTAYTGGRCVGGNCQYDQGCATPYSCGGGICRIGCGLCKGGQKKNQQCGKTAECPGGVCTDLRCPDGVTACTSGADCPGGTGCGHSDIACTSDIAGSCGSTQPYLCQGHCTHPSDSLACDVAQNDPATGDNPACAHTIIDSRLSNPNAVSYTGACVAGRCSCTGPNTCRLKKACTAGSRTDGECATDADCPGGTCGTPPETQCHQQYLDVMQQFQHSRVLRNYDFEVSTINALTETDGRPVPIFTSIPRVGREDCSGQWDTTEYYAGTSAHVLKYPHAIDFRLAADMVSLLAFHASGNDPVHVSKFGGQTLGPVARTYMHAQDVCANGTGPYATPQLYCRETSGLWPAPGSGACPRADCTCDSALDCSVTQQCDRKPVICTCSTAQDCKNWYGDDYTDCSLPVGQSTGAKICKHGTTHVDACTGYSSAFACDRPSGTCRDSTGHDVCTGATDAANPE